MINVDANEADGNNDEVDGVKFNVTIDKNAQPRQEERTFTDPVTGETVTKTVTIVPITLESIIIPKQEGASAADKQEIVVTVPPYVVGPDGTIYEITSIAADAFVSNEPTAIVTTVVLPDTENPLTFEAGAMNTGSDAVNERLSKQRAESVLNYLKTCGISADRMTSEGMSYHMPVASNETAEGRAQNRRVEVYISANENMIKAAENGTLQ